MAHVTLSFLIILISLGSLSAQSFIGKLNPVPSEKYLNELTDTLRILAVMVNFQEDKDGATFGNGKFGSIYSQNYGNDILDPLPHDKSYFESHLEFAKNYYNKVSNGDVNISYEVIADTFSVSKTMRNYSPAPGSSDYTTLAEFSKEVWTIASQINPGINFSGYDIFLIFHAGVGRDITLPGSLGNERDLPSVYLSDKALREILGSNVAGLPVNRFGKYNSLILPETESRELETITGKFLFEITINGLIVASIASHLGLPDLFDTNTGLSAIGRFGLMDGQSIFAYNGCFPPEPSAWEKIYLGWADPIEILPGDYSISLAAKLSATLSDTVIVRIPINSSEYYLIENRIRDVNGDGAKTQVKVGNSIINKQFLKDTTGFRSFDTDSLSGVVVDIDEFDWALPGNGLVVWHIDENVISEKFAVNKINTDKFNRGVDVEEADGVQDIGEKFITIFGDEVIGEGTEFDFWFSGNKSELFNNKFSKDTRPDTKTNSGANSLITIKNFSPISNRMSFDIQYGDSIIKPLFFSQDVPFADKTTLTFIDINRKLFAINSDSSLIVSSGDSIIQSLPYFSNFKPASIKIGNDAYLIGVKQGNPAQQFPTSINFWKYDGQAIVNRSVNLTNYITTTVVLRKTATENYEVLLGTNDGRILIFDLESLYGGNNIPKSERLIESGTILNQLSILSSEIYAIGSGQVNNQKFDFLFTGNSQLKFNDEKLLKLITTQDSEGNVVFVITSERIDGIYYYILKNNEVVNSFLVPSLESAKNFSIADLKNDGNNYIVFNDKTKLFAHNLIGSSADNFPFTLNENDMFIGTPLIADIEGDSRSEIIVFTQNGRVFAFDGGTGKKVEGFPISFGNNIAANPILFNNDGNIGLAGLDSSGSFRGWAISSTLSRVDWAEILGNNNNFSSLGRALSSQKINEFFPSNRAYNYPNPVYDGQTAIRYFVNENSKINIKIFDIAGDFVAELNDDASGGLDNETIWNVTNIQSGVYLARIEASGISGKSESIIIKIAVVK